jgi:hypothetical protein
MVTDIDNFITEEERLQLLEELSNGLDTSKITEDEFYIWDNLEVDELENLNPIFKKILDRQYKLIEIEEGLTDLKLDYFGFATQTRAFPYHADSVWPKEEKDRFLGWPGRDGYTFYQGEWISNYVERRIYTTVLYLNDNFEGGETHFPVLDELYKPKSKKLVGFYCDENHVHGVFPVKNGIRKAFICWFYK